MVYNSQWFDAATSHHFYSIDYPLSPYTVINILTVAAEHIQLCLCQKRERPPPSHHHHHHRLLLLFFSHAHAAIKSSQVFDPSYTIYQRGADSLLIAIIVACLKVVVKPAPRMRGSRSDWPFSRSIVPFVDSNTFPIDDFHRSVR